MLYFLFVGKSVSEYLPDWLHQRALISPERLALAASGERLSFRALDERAGQLAGWLQALRIGAEDRVALLLRNGLPFAALVPALNRLGATLVPLNARLAPAELVWQVAEAHARLLLYDQANAAAAAAIARALPELQAMSIDEASLSTPAPPTRFRLDAAHTILYTSGTTGQPKGAVLTYGNHWWSAVASALNLGLQESDCWLACLPLFHIGGLAILLRGVIYGAPVIIHEAFDPAAVNRAIDDEGVTLVSLVSVMLQRVLEARGNQPFPPTLRCVLLGGGPAPRPLLEACSRQGLPVAQTYGLTEAASQVATLAPAEALRKLGSAGKPLLPTELRIERDSVPAEAGEVGEIVIRGPTVTPGYMNSAEATSQAFREGWFHTGDIGYLDAEGYLYVLDRRDDLIISGGENVYPAEIEAVLRMHPAVEDAGVIGAPDERWGQAPVAFVKVRAALSLTEPALQAFCAERLARYKIPARVQFVEALPRNAAGKLMRRALKEALRD